MTKKNRQMNKMILTCNDVYSVEPRSSIETSSLARRVLTSSTFSCLHWSNINASREIARKVLELILFFQSRVNLETKTFKLLFIPSQISQLTEWNKTRLLWQNISRSSWIFEIREIVPTKVFLVVRDAIILRRLQKAFWFEFLWSNTFKWELRSEEKFQNSLRTSESRTSAQSLLWTSTH